MGLRVHIKHWEAAHSNTTQCHHRTVPDIPRRKGSSWPNDRPSGVIHAAFLPPAEHNVSYRPGWLREASACHVGHDAVTHT